MGAEASCRAEHGGRAGEGKALLETDEVIFRGPFRVAVPLRGVSSLRTEGDWLVLDSEVGTLRLELGAKAAARWRDRIEHPPTRIDKLGVKAGQRVALVGVDDPVLAEELASAGAVVGGGPEGEADVVLLQVVRPEVLARIAAVAEALGGRSSLWVLRPKGKAAAVRDAEVLAAGRAAGLTDVKTMRFSEERTGEKFVVPVSRRR